MTLLQLTGTASSVLEAAQQEPRPFILLFMFLCIISLCIALVFLYKDGQKREANQTEAYKVVGNDVKLALLELTRAIDSLSIEQRSTRQRLDQFSDYVREHK